MSIQTKFPILNLRVKGPSDMKPSPTGFNRVSGYDNQPYLSIQRAMGTFMAVTGGMSHSGLIY